MKNSAPYPLHTSMTWWENTVLLSIIKPANFYRGKSSGMYIILPSMLFSVERVGILTVVPST